ncbi:DUF4350 domain-containing protein [Streptomyces candidus]|uniref:DUF4350 domain-containing protein n=1 Tax=Streptomyces candidus TaxID=67283 RepID=A0A7X0HI79_9ACTN|nr:DUF4350 domain-containing protein [Streptomyces candidus]MBB6436822.1 hypothetical protein [Streptomyces candidus]GHH31924.1 hypothetical protein GCM10018773_00030 [Streptomyces candidus]
MTTAPHHPSTSNSPGHPHTSSAAHPSGTSTPTPSQVWERARGVLLVLGVLLLAGVVLAALQSGDQHGRLDPRSADPQGSRAVAELLKDRGVTIRVVTTLAEATAATGPNSTLLVTSPNLLTPSQQRSLYTAASPSRGRTVLVAPGPLSLRALAPGVRADLPAVPITPREPGCALSAAATAGRVELGGLRYTTRAPHDACYPAEDRPSLLRLTTSHTGDTVLLGAADLLHNERLAHQGNASLALQLLGSRPQLVWYLPSLDDPTATDPGSDGPDATTGFLSHVPSGWIWGTFQLALAAVLAALWRARRLGPVVTEHLPVVIHASETTEGRARLYLRANARDRAASTLRSATRARLASLLGVPAAQCDSPTALLPAVSTRLPGTARDLNSLLFGPTPSHDAGLIGLADELDALEREVRAS